MRFITRSSLLTAVLFLAAGAANSSCIGSFDPLSATNAAQSQELAERPVTEIAAGPDGRMVISYKGHSLELIYDELGKGPVGWKDTNGRVMLFSDFDAKWRLAQSYINEKQKIDDSGRQALAGGCLDDMFIMDVTPTPLPRVELPVPRQVEDDFFNSNIFSPGFWLAHAVGPSWDAMGHFSKPPSHPEPVSRHYAGHDTEAHQTLGLLAPSADD